MVKIGHARGKSFECNRQVEISDYCGNYNYILRPSKNIDKMIEFAKSICENDKVMYSQEQRLSLYQELKVNGEIKNECYCDCSSFIALVLREGGYNVPMYMTTSTALNDCHSVGLQCFTFDISKVQRGDIILYRNEELKTGHIAIVMEADNKVIDKFPKVMEVNITSGVLNVRKGPSTNALIITTLNKGDKVIVREVSNGWAMIDKNNEMLYVSYKYLK